MRAARSSLHRNTSLHDTAPDNRNGEALSAGHAAVSTEQGATCCGGLAGCRQVSLTQLSQMTRNFSVDSFVSISLASEADQLGDLPDGATAYLRTELDDPNASLNASLNSSHSSWSMDDGTTSERSAARTVEMVHERSSSIADELDGLHELDVTSTSSEAKGSPHHATKLRLKSKLVNSPRSVARRASFAYRARVAQPAR